MNCACSGPRRDCRSSTARSTDFPDLHGFLQNVGNCISRHTIATCIKEGRTVPGKGGWIFSEGETAPRPPARNPPPAIRAGSRSSSRPGKVVTRYMPDPEFTTPKQSLPSLESKQPAAAEKAIVAAVRLVNNDTGEIKDFHYVREAVHFLKCSRDTFYDAVTKANAEGAVLTLRGWTVYGSKKTSFYDPKNPTGLLKQPTQAGNGGSARKLAGAKSNARSSTLAATGAPPSKRARYVSSLPAQAARRPARKSKFADGELVADRLFALFWPEFARKTPRDRATAVKNGLKIPAWVYFSDSELAKMEGDKSIE